MKSNYEERKQNRIDAYENLAAKNEQLAKDQFERSQQIASAIPFGQPILVGHHSEKRHRSDVAKIHTSMSASVEADKKSEYYKNKVETLLNGTAISSDDPNALDKLRSKLERLQELQEIYKAVNKVIKNVKISQIEKVEQIQAIGLSESRALKLLQPDFCGRLGFPSYLLTNNNGNMANVKKRIEKLEQVEQMETTSEIINEVELRVSVEDNRVQLYFPGIPSENVRKELKGAGFHWTPSIMAWQRQISSYAIHQAKQILTSLA